MENHSKETAPDLDYYLYHAARWIEKHWKWVVAGVALIIVATLLWVGYRYQQGRTQQVFAEDFYKALKDPDADKALSDLEKKYSGASSVQWAHIARISALTAKKDWPQVTAEATALAKATSDPDVRAIARFALAHGAENDGKIDAAKAALQSIIVESPIYAPLAKVEQARLLAQHGNSEEGKKQLETLLGSPEIASQAALKEWIQNILLWISVNGSTQPKS